MVRVVFVPGDGGASIAVQAPAGRTLKDVAPPGHVAAAPLPCREHRRCLLCHCYPEEAYALVLPAMSAAEDRQLDAVAQRRPTSRLACQITLTEALDGMVVRLPAP